RLVLAGQSFGAFLAFMAADASEDVDAVVATAPAAFGNFDEFYDSWRLNATRLFPAPFRRLHPRFPRRRQGRRRTRLRTRLGRSAELRDAPAGRTRPSADC